MAMNDDSEDPWDDFVGDTDDGGSDDGLYEPPTEETEQPQAPDPQDRDSDVIVEPDDNSDTVVDFNEFDFDENPQGARKALDTANRVLEASSRAIDVLGQLVKASGNPEAARALAALSALPKVAGSFTELAEKQLRRRSSDFNDVPVSVPTDGKEEDALDRVRHAIARSRED